MQRLPDFRFPDLKMPSVRVPSVRLPSLRVPRPRLGGLRVESPRLPRLEVDDPDRLCGHLQFFFYLLMFVALLAIFAGASGVGVVMLIAGAGLHVLRSSLEEVAAQRQAQRERAERKGKQVRLRSHRAARRAQVAAEMRIVEEPEEICVAKAPRPAAARSAVAQKAAATARPVTPRLSTRRRPAVAQPGPSPARKQRVI